MSCREMQTWHDSRDLERWRHRMGTEACRRGEITDMAQVTTEDPMAIDS